MNKKSIIAVFLIILLAAASILGLPLMVKSIERRAQTVTLFDSVKPLPDSYYENMDADGIL